MKKLIVLTLMMIASLSAFAADTEIIFEPTKQEKANKTISVEDFQKQQAKEVAAASEEVVKDESYYDRLYSNLSDVDKRHYLENRVLIRATLETRTSSSSYFGGGIFNSGSSSSMQVDWIPFKGPSQLNRADFYKMVNAIDLEFMQREYEKKARSYELGCLIPGGILAVGGLAMLCTGLGMHIKNSANTVASATGLPRTLMIAGTACLGGCLVPLLVWQFASPKQPDVDINFVVGLASDHNKALLDSY